MESRVRRGEKPASRVRPPIRKSPGRTASHRGTPYRCFLPDLTRFGAPAAQDPGSSQRAVKRGGIVIRTGPEPAKAHGTSMKSSRATRGTFREALECGGDRATALGGRGTATLAKTMQASQTAGRHDSTALQSGGLATALQSAAHEGVHTAGGGAEDAFAPARRRRRSTIASCSSRCSCANDAMSPPQCTHVVVPAWTYCMQP